MIENKVVVITPAYQKEISQNEYLSIKSSRHYLQHYHHVIIAPKKFSNDKEFIQLWESLHYEIVFFDNNYFLNSKTYNKLMMTSEFYQSFSHFNYMLIVQLDVLIFQNSLDYWIKKDIDYVGAPWIIEDSKGIRFNFAGNGGLSLRKISTFIKVLNAKNTISKQELFLKLPITSYLRNIILIYFLLRLPLSKYHLPIFKFLLKGHEDNFWTFYATFFTEKFKVASVEDSLAFAFERHPEFCFKKNHHKLPFGVHAWERYNPEFWNKYTQKISNLALPKYQEPSNCDLNHTYRNII